MYHIIIDNEAKKQLKKIKDIKIQNKISTIIEELAINPYEPTFKFERLKWNKKGYCSKRISKADRIIYRVDDNRLLA
jgi:Txe/YoeB family toxin of toxin-antitoxin system